MSAIRNRVKNHFPSVLLTLLSIVQAVALELLWSHIQDGDYGLEWSIESAIVWFQVAATLLGLILVWVIYASNAMRFRWVPTTGDSVYPFVIGILEFTMIGSLGLEKLGLWQILMALIFAAMVWVSHITMRRARLDPDNQAFFDNVARAQLKDFYPHIAVVCLFLISGVYLILSADTGVMALAINLFTLAVLIWQYVLNIGFWRDSVAVD